jgi:hypothetical protein
MPRNATEWLWLATAAVCALLLGLLGYSLAGAIGLGIVGLGIVFVAVRMDLERGAPVGTDMTESLYASTIAAGPDQRGDDRAKSTAADIALSRYLLWAKLIAVVMGTAAVLIGISPESIIGPE